MFLILLLVNCFTFVATVLILRSFFKQLTAKIAQPTPRPLSSTTLANGQANGHLNDPEIPVPDLHLFDKPATNEASQPDANEIEFSEEVPLNMPADVKFEVEGGDTLVPPEFIPK